MATSKELKIEAQILGIKFFSKMNKSQLKIALEDNEKIPIIINEIKKNCEHDKSSYKCRNCYAIGFCPHNKQKY